MKLHLKINSLFVLAFFILGLNTPTTAWGETSTKPQAQTTNAKKSKWSGDPKQIIQRLKAVTSLVEKSTGARRIAAAGNPEASAMHDQARSFLSDAKAANKRGETKTAKTLLSKASQTMFQAMRAADGGASGKKKEANDFSNRMKSVEVLFSAHKRISKEKKKGKETNDLIQKALDEAQRIKKKGDVATARSKLDEAYILAKLGIEKLRRGDTLIRSLHFESKEEEYHYEVDRNDTHQMLVKMLLKNKPKSSKAMAAKFIKKAKITRKQAEEFASKKAFDEAVKAMEKATKDLVRAIRSAGVFIPG